jgi:hypothetical protein
MTEDRFPFIKLQVGVESQCKFLTVRGQLLDGQLDGPLRLTWLIVFELLKVNHLTQLIAPVVAVGQVMAAVQSAISRFNGTTA